MYFCGMKQNSSMKQNKTKWTVDSMDSRFPENLTRTAHTHGTRVTSTILLSYCPQNHSSIYQPPTGTDMEECNTDTDVTDVFHVRTGTVAGFRVHVRTHEEFYRFKCIYLYLYE